MISQMSNREKILAAAVGGTLFILINVIRLKFFIATQAELKLDLLKTSAEISRYQARENERALWDQRDTWLTERLQEMGDPDAATKKLGDGIKEMAKKRSITVESPSQSSPRRDPYFTALSYGFQAKGDWAAIFEFIQELQAPGQFIVFEQAKLEIDAADKTKMKADLRVAQWYRPVQ